MEEGGKEKDAYGDSEEQEWLVVLIGLVGRCAVLIWGYDIDMQSL